MKSIKYILLGILFGIVMVKSGASSWFRIQEMFRFQSFHMYGIIGTAVILGTLAVFVIKKYNMKGVDGHVIVFRSKEKPYARYIWGGIIFGLGWALTGACPGPLFVNLGYGYLSMLIAIFGALIGTFLYGVIKNRLPH